VLRDGDGERVGRVMELDSSLIKIEWDDARAGRPQLLVFWASLVGRVGSYTAAHGG
jgi:hypothetical protein